MLLSHAAVMYFFLKNSYVRKWKLLNYLQLITSFLLTYKYNKFCSMFRFIHDLAGINNSRRFEKLYHEICYPELELELENRSDNKAFF